MDIRTIKVNGKEYNFLCNWRKNRSGFVHEVELKNADGWTLSNFKVQYYNRTWERYRYQSAMSGCVSALESDRKELLKRNFMTEHNYKKLTESRRVDLEKVYNEDSELKELANLYSEVRDGCSKYNFW